jgi:radical SAM superfamily enzyme YgiQ (UPF0313 family)
MRVEQHLISMPLASPVIPSIQLGCLKAFIDQAFKGRVRTHVHSAFFTIPFLLGDRELLRFAGENYPHNEWPYLFLCLRRFGKINRMSGREIGRLIKKMGPFEPAGRWAMRLMPRLDKATVNYIQSQIVGGFRKHAVNVIGFSVVHHQAYSSIYGAKTIESCSGKCKTIFLFGGSQVMVPSVREAFRRFSVPGFFLTGEGEKPLRNVLEKILLTGKDDFPKLGEKIACIQGLVPISGQKTSGHEGPSIQGQVEDMDELPLPDLDEYFQCIRRMGADKETSDLLMHAVQIPLEGSRGCFMKCDFCGFNYSWHGFRQKSPGHIAGQVQALSRKYPARTVRFVDSTTDTWVEKYAEALIDQGRRVPSILMLRANHPETFWTKLALSGVESIHLGMEALSTPHLKNMKKGTTAVHNVLGMKYLRELGIRSTGTLIAWHPRSTPADVRETRRVVENIYHFEKMNFAIFGLAHGSPLVEQLPDMDKRNLTLEGLEAMPQELLPYLIGTYYDLPKSVRPGKKLISAWSRFIRWYERLDARHSESRGTLSVRRNGSRLLIFSDTRMGRNRRFSLNDREAEAYALCHHGATQRALAREAKMTVERVKKLVERWIQMEILVEVDHHYIATALRPREELTDNYLREWNSPKDLTNSARYDVKYSS